MADILPKISTGTPLESVTSNIYRDAYKSAEKFDQDTDKGIQKMENEPLPRPPELTPAPEMKDFQSDPMKNFGSSAMFLATFGSLLTKNHLTSALSSGASVMDAFNRQDANNFKQAYDKWKVDTENAWKMADYNQQLYKDVIGRDETELKARAVSAKDNVMLHMADAKMGLQLQRDRDKQIKDGQDQFNKITQLADSAYDKAISDGKTQEEANMAALRAFGEAKNALGGKDVTGLTDPEYNEFKSDPESAALADAFASGVPPANLVRGIGKGAGNRLQAIQRLAIERHPNLDIAKASPEYLSTQSEARALGTQTAKLATAGREADNLGDLLVTASDKFDRTSLPPVNTALSAYERNTGDPKVVAYGAALNSYINAYARAINPTGQARISDKDHAREMLAQSFSKQQVKAVVEQLKKETQAAREAPEFVKKSMSGDSSAQDVFNDGGSKDYPLPLPKGNDFEKGKWYTNDKGEIGKYVGEKNGQHVFE